MIMSKEKKQLTERYNACHSSHIKFLHMQHDNLYYLEMHTDTAKCREGHGKWE